jgi:transposase
MIHTTVTAIRSPSNSNLPDHVVAFEVSKHQLVVHTLPADRQVVIANTPAAVRRLLSAQVRHNRRARLGSMLVLCEATGGYEAHVLEAAIELGIEAHKAHGTRVRHFAKYKGLKAKNDPIDARLIALYGLQTENLVRYVPPSAGLKALRALKERRHDLQVMLQAENNRLEHVTDARVLKSLKASIRSLAKALKAIEAEIALLLESEQTLARKAELMCTVPGVGITVATTLIAHMPELGTLPRAQAAALAGVAPYDDDSGERKGRRSIDAGRSAVRRCLYMAALVAKRTCPHLRDFAQRIIARGNPPKVAITAVMRKLIVIINAVLASQQSCHYAKST